MSRWEHHTKLNCNSIKVHVRVMSHLGIRALWKSNDTVAIWDFQIAQVQSPLVT